MALRLLTPPLMIACLVVRPLVCHVLRRLALKPVGVGRNGERRLLYLFGLMLTLISTGSLAHELRPAIADIRATAEGVSIELRINLEALISETGPEHSDSDDAPTAALYDSLRLLEPAALEAKWQEYLPVFLSRVQIEALTSLEGEPRQIQLQPYDARVPAVGDTRLPRDSRLRFRLSVPAGTQAIRWQWAPVLGPVVIRAERPAQTVDQNTEESDSIGLSVDSATDDLSVLGNQTAPDAPGFSQYLQPGQLSDPIPVTLAAGATFDDSGSDFIDYVLIGFEHIVPKGVDHILFVIGLFLLSPRLKPIVWQVSMFTIAHSITLALGIFGIVVLSPAIVEPLIALSIAVICIENLIGERHLRARLFTVFAFGLLHGLGFAGVLNDIGLSPGRFASSLLAFNIGVELGQLCVVLLCFALVGWWFRNRPWYRSVIVIPASLLIGAIGAYWFIQRLGLSG